MTTIEAIERLGHAEKVRHWSQEKPWAGLRLKNQTTFEARQVRMDQLGHITEQPPLVGKPCFGQPIVYVRQGATLMHRNHDGAVRPTRCGRCKVREACVMVCHRRLNVTPEIGDAYRLFVGRGGAQGLQEKHLKAQAQVVFDRLVTQLIRHGQFNSVNDAHVSAHYDRERELHKARDAERKRAARAKRLASGFLDDGAMDLLCRHRLFRAHLLRELVNSQAQLPSRLAKMPPASVEVTADAWLAREVLKHTRQKVNASSVAREMIRMKPNRYANHESLRQRTSADLARVELLEGLVPPGAAGPVWPRFDLLTEIADEENLPPTTI
ncbi:hypothetical protein OLX02_03950 [Novosphingobium sp. KCTC 2891]|uniref:hypothetical protein n=1 Tax=Novosphingobium sp. KCTC 2891 TaxID=2989730 RepID=UPI0022235040|nr:hypothetical protein [Novosphingobium sp. KCTC 2891]MCW1381968.1 hypothetical protein [Novosphingobium sp. KCTC 2891]